jgi:hypothetical protein
MAPSTPLQQAQMLGCLDGSAPRRPSMAPSTHCSKPLLRWIRACCTNPLGSSPFSYLFISHQLKTHCYLYDLLKHKISTHSLLPLSRKRRLGGDLPSGGDAAGSLCLQPPLRRGRLVGGGLRVDVWHSLYLLGFLF